MSNIENLPPVPDQTSTTRHSGNLEGDMKEQGLPGAPKIVPGMDIPETVYAGFETRPPETYERGPIDQGKAAVRESHTLTPETQKKSKKGLLVKLGAGVLVVGGALFGVHAAATSGNKTETLPPNPTDVASAPVTPGAQETGVATTPEQQIKSLEIKSGQTQEALAKNITDRLSQWDMAGADKASAEAAIAAGFSANERDLYTQQLASAQEPLYAQALFGESWATNTDAMIYIKRAVKANADNLSRRIISSSDSQKYEFKENYESSEILHGDTNEGTLAINVVFSDIVNSRIAALGVIEQNGAKGTYNVNYKTVANTIVFENIQFSSQQ